MAGIILYLLLRKILGAKTPEKVDFLHPIPGRLKKSEKQPKSADFGAGWGGIGRDGAGIVF